MYNGDRHTTDGEDISTLKPVSIRLLYEGMTVPEDIYDSDCSRLLMSSGNTLTADLMERMRRLNSGRDVIYVGGRTLQTMSSKRPNIEITKRKEFESSCGYTAALVKVFELYRDITISKKVNRGAFDNVADYLSQLVKTSTPSDIMTLINIIAPIDDYLYRHALNVGLLNGLIARWLGLSEERVDKLVLIGLLHDCGHALMPQKVLLSSRVFSKIDYEVIKMHPIRTEQLLVDYPDDIRLTACAHHEKIDGSGYPKGVSGSSVTGAARITAVSDIYEAIVSSRSYRPPRSPFHALSILGDMTPLQLDNDVVNILKEHLPGTLIGKPVTMSDGTIGIVREFDPDDVKYPTVEISNRLTKTRKLLHCVSMYLDE